MISSHHRVYISGPMTGHENYNAVGFSEGRSSLFDFGCNVVCPWVMNEPWFEKRSYEWFMKRDIKELTSCDAILLLEGWHTSRGAVVEFHVAHICGLKFYTLVNGVIYDSNGEVVKPARPLHDILNTLS